MMHTQIQQPVRSEYRHYQSPFIRQCLQTGVLQEHVTTASQQHYNKPFVFNPNRPHINIRLDDQHSVKALVDSGSSICLGDSSLIHHIKAKYPNAPPISVTDVHGGRKQTLGCYTSTLSVQDKLPHPLVNKTINIHMQDNLSSELVLGTDFLADHGAVIDVRSNKIIFYKRSYFQSA